jgi:hypothetical protein
MMTIDTRKSPLLILPLATAICLAGIATASGTPEGFGTSLAALDSVRCEIAATPSGGMIAIEPRVVTDQALHGQYTFTVSSVGQTGSANIRQGGNFSANAGQTVKLASVMLGSAGAGYTATLEVSATGFALECEERVGGRA